MIILNLRNKPEIKMTTKQQVLTILTQTLEDLVDELYRVIVDLESRGFKDGSLISPSTKLIIVKKLIVNTSILTLLKHFREKLLPFEEKVKARDEKFFIETQGIFPVPEEHIVFLKDLWTNKNGFGFTVQQKDIITLYIENIILIVKEYDLL